MLSDLLASFPRSAPYSLAAGAKGRLLGDALMRLTAFHHGACPQYGRIIDNLWPDWRHGLGVADVPFLPARLFKLMRLVSVPEADYSRTVSSSGTSGQQVSKVRLDRETALAQSSVLRQITAAFAGSRRLPVILLDTPATATDPKLRAARGSGLAGFKMQGSHVIYALTEEMQPDMPALKAFLKQHEGSPVLLAGYTFIVWQHLVKGLGEMGERLGIASGWLFHGGGWKKLREKAVSSADFKAACRNVLGNVSVHDYYGMAEQLGSVFMECEHGRLHCSVFSDVIIRRPRDFEPVANGERGLVQVMSVLPGSYPGHSILTEDEGEIMGEDDCPCGRLGKYFRIHGRIARAELRGCGDTYQRN